MMLAPVEPMGGVVMLTPAASPSPDAEARLDFANDAFRDVVPPFIVAAATNGLSPRVIDAVIEQLPVGIAVAGADGRLIYANRAARAFPPVCESVLHTVLEKAILTGTEARVERVEYRGSTPWRRWVSITASPIAGPNGCARGAVATVVDDTASIQATEWRPIIESLQRL
jgi:PAS domain-containing protein